jgi:hypothetical protein
MNVGIHATAATKMYHSEPGRLLLVLLLQLCVLELQLRLQVPHLHMISRQDSPRRNVRKQWGAARKLTSFSKHHEKWQ